MVLDLEGAELDALHSIPWKKDKEDGLTIDVLCIEVEPKFRPEGYPEKIIDFLKDKGFQPYSHLQLKNQCNDSFVNILSLTLLFSFVCRVYSRRFHSIKTSWFSC
jgi:hypothetical protein